MELHRKSEFEAGGSLGGGSGTGAAGASPGVASLRVEAGELEREMMEKQPVVGGGFRNGGGGGFGSGGGLQRVAVLPRTEPVTPRGDRRKDNRKPVLVDAKLRVVDPFGGKEEYEIQTRDTSLSGVSFLLKDLLTVGQFCEMETMVKGKGRVIRKVEVVRSRPLSNGKYEMAVEYRGGEMLPDVKQKRRRR